MYNHQRLRKLYAILIALFLPISCFSVLRLYCQYYCSISSLPFISYRYTSPLASLFSGYVPFHPSCHLSVAPSSFYLPETWQKILILLHNHSPHSPTQAKIHPPDIQICRTCTKINTNDLLNDVSRFPAAKISNWRPEGSLLIPEPNLSIKRMCMELTRVQLLQLLIMPGRWVLTTVVSAYNCNQAWSPLVTLRQIPHKKQQYIDHSHFFFQMLFH